MKARRIVHRNGIVESVRFSDREPRDSEAVPTVKIECVAASGKTYAVDKIDSPADLEEAELYSTIRLCVRRQRAGAATRAEIMLVHLWQNVCRWVEARDLTFDHAPAFLGVGWWKRTGFSQPNLSHLAALLRGVAAARREVQSA